MRARGDDLGGMNDSVLSRSTHSGVLFSYERQMTPGEKIRKETTLRSSMSRGGFGAKSERFGSDFTITPGVGAYDLLDGENSCLLLDSPSLSRKGYISTFRSKSPRLSPAHKNPGVPGPATYNLSVTEVSHISGDRPSTAFVQSGNGRVPFPPPNKVPGPCAYRPVDDPGSSPLLKAKRSATFESKSKRDSIFKVNDVPAVGRYQLPETLHHPSGDLQWTKSAYVRFQDVGKDNKVPGPQRYFDSRNDEEYFPKRSLRSSGAYRGKYCGKMQSTGPVLSTFGVVQDRFQNSTFGRLDLVAQLPGPGAYSPEFAGMSVSSPPRCRTPSPNRPPVKQRSPQRQGELSPLTLSPAHVPGLA